jgi:methylenetetrahydrofolate dehydrogenase (NADP+)/methenyltetrahydrofolate cyclohydrolase
MSIIMDGNNVAKMIYNDIKVPINVKFVSILVGDDPASITYLKIKEKKCSDLGIQFKLIKLDTNITTSELIEYVKKLNNDILITSYIIQLPLPLHIDTNSILDEIDPLKDADGISTKNMGKIIINKSNNYPATPFGIVRLLEYYKISTFGKHIVIIGKSKIVGLPLFLMLTNEEKYGATITICDKYTQDLQNIVKTGDIIIVATGVHHLLNKKFEVKNDSCLIDVGIHKIVDEKMKNGFRIEGDIDFEYFKDKCKYITPVPGGVGPMTVASLMYNICNCGNK